MADLIANMQAVAGAGGGEATFVEDVFSTYLYTGNSSTQTITNGVDLDGEGGLVWAKNRTATWDHVLFDTERGIEQYLQTNETDAEAGSSGQGVTSYNSDGFTLASSSLRWNSSSHDYVSWTFRKAPKFFDVVTYTGTGSVQNISHNLGSVPGMVIVKSVSAANDWFVWHREMHPTAPNAVYMRLTTSARASNTTIWNNTSPTATDFTVGANGFSNFNGREYVAYLFAHNNNDGDFGETGDQDIIKCGSFTNDGGNAQYKEVGFEPQWILMKQATAASNWYIVDNMRGFPALGSGSVVLEPNTSDAEAGFSILHTDANGFYFDTFGTAGATWIYIAIRRGPMKTPTSGTEVFDVNTYTASGGTGNQQTTGFPVDLAVIAPRSSTDGWKHGFVSRLTGGRNYLQSNNTSAETSVPAGLALDDMTGYEFEGVYFNNSSPPDMYNLNFRRAPGFFDVVAFEGNGTSTRTLNHNLGVKPEMIIIKERESGTGSWYVYHSALGATHFLSLNATHSAFSNSIIWKNTEPTESVFTTGINPSGEGVISYLFASVAGISKVGSYTGDGNATRVIDCGFSNGARFVMIRRTDDNDNWYVYDTERGIVSGNDPYLQLNESDAENTSTDFIDPNNSGFTVSNNKFNPLNHEFIFYAIA